MKEKITEKKKKKCKAIGNGTCRFRSLFLFSLSSQVVRRIFSYKKFDREYMCNSTVQIHLRIKFPLEKDFSQMDTEIRMKITG